MSWIAIRDALVARFEAVLPTCKVYGRNRDTKEPPTSDKFRALFQDLAEERLHALLFTHTSRTSEQHTDGIRKRVTHGIEIAYFLAFNDTCNSEETFEVNVESICRDLEIGDDTLDGAAHTMGLPNCETIGDSGFYGLHVHDARIKLQVVELVS